MAWRTHRDFQLLLLSLLTTSIFVARTSLGPLQETMRGALALSDNQMALLQGPPLALGVILAIPIGLLIDRQSRVRLVSLFMVLALLANWLSAWATNFTLLLAARCLTGLAASTIWTAVLSLIADWYPPVQRGRATTVAAVGAVAGMAAAFALGGLFLVMAGSGPDTWRWAMLGLGLPILAGLLLMLAIREPARSGSAIEKPVPREVYAELWRHRAILLPLLLSFALVGGIADGASVIWAAPTLSRAFALTPERVGAIMGSVLLVNGVLGPVLGGALADFGQRTGGPYRTVTVLMGLLVLGIPTGLFALAPGVASSSVLLTLFLIAGTAFQVAVFALTTIVIPNELRGSCLAFLLATALLFAFGVAPLMVSQLSVMLGGPAMIGRSLAMICVGSSLSGAVAFWFGRRPFRAWER